VMALVRPDGYLMFLAFSTHSEGWSTPRISPGAAW